MAKKLPAKKLPTKKPPKKKPVSTARPSSPNIIANPDASVLDRIGAVQLSDKPMKNSLFYGKSGHGKTTLACSFPGQILHISVGIEEGTESVTDVENLQTVTVNSLDELVEVYDNVKSLGFDTVITDTIGRIQDLAILDVIGKPPSSQIGFGEITRSDWGEIVGKVKDVIERSIKLAKYEDIYNVLLAQQREFNTGEDGSDELDPYVAGEASPAVIRWLNPSVDYIGRCCIRSVTLLDEDEMEYSETRYSLQICPDEKYITKFRKPKKIVLPDYVDDPTYEKLAALVRPE